MPAKSMRLKDGRSVAAEERRNCIVYSFTDLISEGSLNEDINMHSRTPPPNAHVDDGILFTLEFNKVTIIIM